jgi:hypothetical protein
LTIGKRLTQPRTMLKRAKLSSILRIYRTKMIDSKDWKTAPLIIRMSQISTWEILKEQRISRTWSRRVHCTSLITSTKKNRRRSLKETISQVSSSTRSTVKGLTPDAAPLYSSLLVYPRKLPHLSHLPQDKSLQPNSDPTGLKS